jgi:hypothetical protein
MKSVYRWWRAAVLTVLAAATVFVCGCGYG